LQRESHKLPLALSLTAHGPEGKTRRPTRQGLISDLKQTHDDLDAGVFDAYCMPSKQTGEAILQRLVDLNTERAKEDLGVDRSKMLTHSERRIYD
jgi:hypothetical protein